ncbi:low temperature requirement protein A [Almyronema epifaneia]|uniref:Low temperature requirement protein A n=1 Tax=Almyronema epifaneia S1 TaxID=2991925 RepID=A0ABW6IB23_9CYAN
MASRQLLQPPRLRSLEDGEERRATWLELFYDLVFVVAIAELAHFLSGHVSAGGFWGFVLLFIPVWWCWVGATFYATRFDTDDISDRLLTLTQMAIIAIMAANVHQGLGESGSFFAGSYAAFRSVLIMQYLSAGFYIPAVRPLTAWYATGFGASLALWLLSIWVPAPWRFALWVCGLLIDFCTPLTAGRLVSQFPPSMTHIPERVGLFTIIVLGESVVGVVRGLSELEWTAVAVLTALLGLSSAFSLWWLYFDTVDGSPLKAMKRGQMGISLLWLYTHLPLTLGLVMTGVGVERVLSMGPATVPSWGDRWLICGGVAIALICLAIIHLITCTLGTVQRRKVVSAYRLVGATFVLALGTSTSLSALGLVLLVAVTCVVEIGLDLFAQRRQRKVLQP